MLVFSGEGFDRMENSTGAEEVAGFFLILVSIQHPYMNHLRLDLCTDHFNDLLQLVLFVRRLVPGDTQPCAL